MIVVQTPLRISFLGGGTDLPSFYRQEDGWVVSSAIDKYIFVIIKNRFDEKIRVGYTRTEMVDSVDEVQHELVREALRKSGIAKGVEISTMGDIPSAGSGLGSSSTVTVGLLNAMYNHQNAQRNAETLAREACEIEIDTLGKPIGKQDQYIASYGGLRFIRFCANEQVMVESLTLSDSTRQELGRRLLLFYTNVTRKSETILKEQVANTNDRMPQLRAMKTLALQARSALESGNLNDFGQIMHEGWMQKRQLASKITNPMIDELYTAAREAGAVGGKITGAGGGGFLLLYCPLHNQDRVRERLRHQRELPITLESGGSKVLFNDGR
ncbi:MAG: GHMP kinase [Chloroflexi bacterium]|nr:GHMP kinase [Chloroflexota bacterium]